MGLFQKIKKLLGFGNQVAHLVVPIVDEVAELAAELRGVDLVGELQSPNALCLWPGHYGLIRAGELVERPSGAIETCRMDVGTRFPPGLQKGDRWRRFADAGVFLER